MSVSRTAQKRGADAGTHRLRVTPDNFVRAESHGQFMAVVKRGGFGRLVHERDFQPAGREPAAWADCDVLRSRGVFDLEAGPVVVTLPETGVRFMSLEVLDEDHYTVASFYGAGTYSFSYDNVSTRYMLVIVRILVDAAEGADFAAVHALQDAIGVRRQGGGRFVVPDWDPVSQARVRAALQLLGNTAAGEERAFGARGEVDPVRHLIGAATRWEGCPTRHVACLAGVPQYDDGQVVHRLDIGHVPVDGFWSVTVYDGNGRFLTDVPARRAVNGRGAGHAAHRPMSVQFGGCLEADCNCLLIGKGWRYIVRLYRPRAEVLGGRWMFPEAVPVHSPGSLS
jgi:hypothetical protein